MVIISCPRGQGKTTHAARLVREHNGILITAFNVDFNRDLARRHGLRQDQVFTYRQVLDGRLRGVDLTGRPVIADDADVMLQRLLGDGVTLDMVTMSPSRHHPVDVAAGVAPPERFNFPGYESIGMTISPPQFVGRMPIRTDVEVRPAPPVDLRSDDPLEN